MVKKLTKGIIIVEIVVLIFVIILFTTNIFQSPEVPLNQTEADLIIQTQCHTYCMSFENESVFAFGLNKTPQGVMCRCIGNNVIEQKLFEEDKIKGNTITGNIIYPIE